MFIINMKTTSIWAGPIVAHQWTVVEDVVGDPLANSRAYVPLLKIEIMTVKLEFIILIIKEIGGKEKTPGGSSFYCRPVVHYSSAVGYSWRIRPEDARRTLTPGRWMNLPLVH